MQSIYVLIVLLYLETTVKQYPIDSFYLVPPWRLGHANQDVSIKARFVVFVQCLFGYTQYWATCAYLLETN